MKFFILFCVVFSILSTDSETTKTKFLTMWFLSPETDWVNIVAQQASETKTTMFPRYLYRYRIRVGVMMMI